MFKKQKGIRFFLKCLSITLLFVLVYEHAICQTDSIAEKAKEYILKYPVSSVFGELFLNTAGVSLGLEVVGEKGFSFSQEAGYIFNTDRKGFVFGATANSVNGIRLTSELRKYEHPERFFPSRGLFASIEFDNMLLVVEEQTIENHKDVIGYRGAITFNIGSKFLLSKKDKNRFTLDFLVGAGIGFSVSNKSDTEFENFPWLNADLKLGYILGR